MSVTTDAATESPSAASDAGAAVRWLDTLIREQAGRIWLVRLGSLLSLAGILLFYAGLASVLVAALAELRQSPPISSWLAMAAGILSRLSGGLLRDLAGQGLSITVRHALHSRLFAEATRRGPFALSRLGSTAWWSQRQLEQVDALHGFFARYRPALESARIVPLSLAAVVLSLDWIAGLLLLVAMPLIPLFMALIGMGTQALQDGQQARQARLASELLQRLESLPWLRRMGALRESEQSVADAAEGHRALVMRVLRVAFLSSSALELFSALAIGLVALYVGFALLGLIGFGPAVDMDAWTGLFVLMLAPECFLPLRQLAQAHHERSGALAAAESLLTLCAEVDSLTGPMLSTDSAGHLVFDGVTFAYGDPARPVLQDVSFAIAAGQVVGIAGPSGSGKSTVLALAAGFLSPAKGRISRADRWAWVPQRAHLFSGDLRRNLQIASVGPLDDAVLVHALEAVGMGLPQQTLPHGLDTRIGDGAAGVSGGQAQRIGVARALLSGAPLWLFDEPTAALDQMARDRLLERLIPLARQSKAAVLIASHDQAVLDCCDRVIDLSALKRIG